MTQSRTHPSLVRLALIGCLLAPSGCMHLGWKSDQSTPQTPQSKSTVSVSKPNPSGVRQIAVTWNPRVVYSADPTRGGAITPGLTGRMYLFGENPSHPLTCEGSLVVDLWDHTPIDGDTTPRQLEQWNIDPATLKRLMKEDIIGQGYSIYLPWSSYRPDMTQVHLIVKFQPVEGEPILTQSGISVDHSATKELNASKMPSAR